MLLHQGMRSYLGECKLNFYTTKKIYMKEVVSSHQGNPRVEGGKQHMVLVFIEV